MLATVILGLAVGVEVGVGTKHRKPDVRLPTKPPTIVAGTSIALPRFSTSTASLG